MEISSFMVGVFNFLVFLFMFVLGVLLFGVKVCWFKLLGVFIGLVGVVMFILFSWEVGMEGNFWYGLLVIVGCICYVINFNIIVKYLKEMKLFIISVIFFIIVGILVFVYLF